MQPKVKSSTSKDNVPYTLNMSALKRSCNKSDDDSSEESGSPQPSPGTGESGNREELSALKVSEAKTNREIPSKAL